MPRSKRIRFGLQRLLVLCVVAGAGLALVIRVFVSHAEFERSIRTVRQSTGFCGFNRSYDIVDAKFYDNHRGQPVAILLCIYDFDCEVPAMRREYTYTNRGGILFVDAARVIPGSRQWLFVNGPYGHTVKMQLDIREAAELSKLRTADAFQWRMYWQQRVEPRLYDLEGDTIGDMRDGPWTYRLKDGRRYMDVAYHEGERHGDWTTYYPDGVVRTKRRFANGKPNGTWEYYNALGELLGTLEFEKGIVLGQRGSSGGTSGDSQWVQGASYSWGDNGGSFTINGQVMLRPTLSSDLLMVQ